MIRTTITALIALTALVVSANAQVAGKSTPARPALKPEAIVTGDIVRIGDLIENAGIVSSVPIFRAPDLGHTGTISADSVLEAVRSHALIGLDTDGIREIVVRRASRIIQATDVEDVVAQALSTRFDLGPSKDIVVNLSRELKAVYVEPSAQGSPRIAHIDFDARSGRFDATLEIPASGSRSSSRKTVWPRHTDGRNSHSGKASGTRCRFARVGYPDGPAAAQRNWPRCRYKSIASRRICRSCQSAARPTFARRRTDEA